VRELRERGIVPLEPLPECSPHVQIRKYVLPGAGILAGTLCGVRQVATRHAGGDCDDVFLGINLAGNSIASQRSQEIALRDGDAILLTQAAGDFVISRPTPAHFLGLRVPRKALAPLVANLDVAAMRLIPGATPSLRLLAGYVRAMGDKAMLGSPPLCRVVATHIHDLMALSAGSTREAAASAYGRGVRAARLQAIKTYIAENLGDYDLRVSAVAARQQVTPRYVQKLFEVEATTFSEFVRDQRLARAHRLLTDPLLAKRAVSSIAFDVGFGDLSYFTRSFRRRYGATPSEVRNIAAR
jgi:AraC-like DNA-binding protein